MGPYWWCGDIFYDSVNEWEGKEVGRHNCMISPAQGAASGPLMSPVLFMPISVLPLLWLLHLRFERKTFLMKPTLYISETNLSCPCENKMIFSYCFSLWLFQPNVTNCFHVGVTFQNTQSWNGLMVFRFYTRRSLRIVCYKRNNSALPFQNSICSNWALNCKKYSLDREDR